MDELRLSRGEYWLLETEVEIPPPVNWLVDDGMQALNKVNHGMSKDVLAPLPRLKKVEDSSK